MYACAQEEPSLWDKEKQAAWARREPAGLFAAWADVYTLAVWDFLFFEKARTGAPRKHFRKQAESGTEPKL